MYDSEFWLLIVVIYWSELLYEKERKKKKNKNLYGDGVERKKITMSFVIYKCSFSFMVNSSWNWWGDNSCWTKILILEYDLFNEANYHLFGQMAPNQVQNAQQIKITNSSDPTFYKWKWPNFRFYSPSLLLSATAVTLDAEHEGIEVRKSFRKNSIFLIEIFKWEIQFVGFL